MQMLLRPDQFRIIAEAALLELSMFSAKYLGEYTFKYISQ